MLPRLRGSPRAPLPPRKGGVRAASLPELGRLRAISLGAKPRYRPHRGSPRDPSPVSHQGALAPSAPALSSRSRRARAARLAPRSEVTSWDPGVRVIQTSVDTFNGPRMIGSDLVIVHNPHGQNPRGGEVPVARAASRPTLISHDRRNAAVRRSSVGGPCGRLRATEDAPRAGNDFPTVRAGLLRLPAEGHLLDLRPRSIPLLHAWTRPSGLAPAFVNRALRALPREARLVGWPGGEVLLGPGVVADVVAVPWGRAGCHRLGRAPKGLWCGVACEVTLHPRRR